MVGGGSVCDNLGGVSTGDEVVLTSHPELAHCGGGGGTMGHIIALPYPKSLIDLSTGKLMLNIFLLMDWNKKLYICLFLNLIFEHKQILQEIIVDQNLNCISRKPQWVYAHVDNF